MAKAEGVVIKEMKYKDNSKILTIFTRENGKITVMARGACNPKSRLISNTELFFHNQYELYRGKTFYYINDTDTVNSFYPIRESMDRLMYGSYFLELVDLGMIEEAKNEKVFDLLLKGLRVLSNLEDNFLRFVLAYEMKFIAFLGYRPNIKTCVSCGKDRSDKWKFTVKGGGLLCSKCFYTDPYAYKLESDDIQYLGELLFSQLDNLDKVDIGEDKSFKLHKIMVKYILDKLDRKSFKSLDMYRTILLEGVDRNGH